MTIPLFLRSRTQSCPDTTWYSSANGVKANRELFADSLASSTNVYPSFKAVRSMTTRSNPFAGLVGRGPRKWVTVYHSDGSTETKGTAKNWRHQIGRAHG